eukprot:scaffold2355_cov382-Prasinococcus_capsulatus_cf.AAC.10
MEVVNSTRGTKGLYQSPQLIWLASIPMCRACPPRDQAVVCDQTCTPESVEPHCAGSYRCGRSHNAASQDDEGQHVMLPTGGVAAY